MVTYSHHAWAPEVGADQRLAEMKTELEGRRRQREEIKSSRDADPYDHRWPTLLVQVSNEVEQLARSVAALEREISPPASDGPSSGQFWSSRSVGDSRWQR